MSKKLKENNHLILLDKGRARTCEVIVTAVVRKNGKQFAKLQLAHPEQSQGGLAFGYAKIAPFYVDPNTEYPAELLFEKPVEAYHYLLSFYKKQYKEQLEAIRSTEFYMDRTRNAITELEASNVLKYKIGSRVWAIVRIDSGELDVAKERIDRINPDDLSAPYHYKDDCHRGWLSPADVFDARVDAVKELQRRLREHCERRCTELVVPDDYEEDDE